MEMRKEEKRTREGVVTEREREREGDQDMEMRKEEKRTREGVVTEREREKGTKTWR